MFPQDVFMAYTSDLNVPNVFQYVIDTKPRDTKMYTTFDEVFLVGQLLSDGGWV